MIINERKYKCGNLSNYEDFLNLLEKRILQKDFQNNLIEFQKNDLKNYARKVTIKELKKYIDEYRGRDFYKNAFTKWQILLPGNPEIVFKLCLESVIYDINLLIYIEDFCSSQNAFLINFINQVIIDCELKNTIKMKNLVTDDEIIRNAKNVDKTILIGNSNLYNRLEDRITNLQFYPYGIFEMYSDSEDFEELKKTIYEYTTLNQFEIDFYDELKFEDAIKAINRDGYKFCSILISKDEEKIKKFSKDINSKYVIINKNPFKEISFNLEII